MFRSLLILLIINTYGRGLGIPLNQNSPNGIIASSLEELANGCPSKFLVNEITDHLKECNVAFGKPYTETQFQCGMFYDMTSQLCAAVASHKLELNQDDYTSQINVDINISHLCDMSKHWNVTDLPTYPSYKESVSKLFYNDITCGRLCGGPGLFDANYYCKFYKWGMDVLKSPVVPIQPSSVDNKIDPVPSVEDAKTQISDTSNSIKANGTQLVEAEKSIPNEPTRTNANTNANTGNMPETYYVAAGEQELPPSKQVASERHIAGSNNQKDVENHDVKLPEKDKQSNVSVGSNIDEGTIAVKEVVEVVEEGNPAEEKPVIDSLKPVINKEKPVIDDEKPVIDNPKTNLGLNGESEDYQDSDDVKEGLLDLQNSDDGVDPVIGDANDSPDPLSTKPSTIIFRPISTYNEDTQRNIYRDMPEAFLDEQDSNFFPFFLTAVILAALFYILYHNKSKVSKVVLGLIVEGRQPGRRRGSRGPAYRRLDTLEQAMSSSTAAAPSKIIY